MYESCSNQDWDASDFDSEHFETAPPQKKDSSDEESSESNCENKAPEVPKTQPKQDESSN